MIMRTLRKATVSCALALSLACAAVPAGAQEQAAEFYRDKQLRMVVPTPAGGLYDLLSRMVAEHMPKHLGQSTRMIVQNMGGAGGLVAANYMANIAPKDGTVIAAAHGSTSTASLFSPKEAKFKSNELQWLGSVTKDPFVAYVWNTWPIRSLDDLKTREAPFGGNAVGSASIDYAIYGRDMFGLKIKIITGYPNSVDVKLAMERGELAGTFGNGWSSLKTGEPTWLKEKKITLLAQFGLTKHPELPDVPLFIDLAKTEDDRKGLELVLARQDIARPFYAPPATPADRVTLLRRAFDTTMVDPAFLAMAERNQAPVDGPMSGEAVQATVERLVSTKPEVVNRMERMIADFQKK